MIAEKRVLSDKIFLILTKSPKRHGWYQITAFEDDLTPIMDIQKGNLFCAYKDFETITEQEIRINMQ